MGPYKFPWEKGRREMITIQGNIPVIFCMVALGPGLHLILFAVQRQFLFSFFYSLPFDGEDCKTINFKKLKSLGRCPWDQAG